MKKKHTGKLNLYRAFMANAATRPLFANEGVDPLSGAFDAKVAVHPGMGGAFVDKAHIGELWHSLVREPRRGKTTAYFHIPFCETRCLFCGFFSNPYMRETSRAYVDALLKEIRSERELPAIRSGPVHAVYLGGGTPTALAAADLERLLACIRECLPLANDCEITVEGRIHHFSEEKMVACIKGGANRFSIGVQTFDTDIRRRLGRLADTETILKKLETLKCLDQAAIVIDLIYGLPGQSLEIWERDLDILLELALDGADLYQLNVFRDGALEKAVEKGRISPPPPLAQQSRYFARGVATMTRARYRRLSISHWGRTTRERNFYNLLFKRRSPTLAFGACAGGNLRGHFFFLENNLESYLKSSGHAKPVMAMVYPMVHDTLVGALTGGLEVGHINLRCLGNRLGFDLETFYQPLLAQWKRAGLVETDEGRITLTLAGQFWQVNLTQAMIDYVHANGPATGFRSLHPGRRTPRFH